MRRFEHVYLHAAARKAVARRNKMQIRCKRCPKRRLIDSFIGILIHIYRYTKLFRNRFQSLDVVMMFMRHKYRADSGQVGVKCIQRRLQCFAGDAGVHQIFFIAAAYVGSVPGGAGKQRHDFISGICQTHRRFQFPLRKTDFNF